MLRSVSLVVLSVLVTIVAASHLNAPRSVAFSPPTAGQQNELGLLHMRDQNFEKAFAAFRSAIEHEPQVAEYHFNLAYLLGNAREAALAATGYTASELFEEMQRESRIARALKPNDYEIAESYATNFQMAEKFGETPDGEKAAAAWEYCLALRRKEYLLNPTAWSRVLEVPPLLQLGRIALQSNDREQAKAYFEEALDLIPDLIRGSDPTPGRIDSQHRGLDGRIIQDVIDRQPDGFGLVGVDDAFDGDDRHGVPPAVAVHLTNHGGVKHRTREDGSAPKRHTDHEHDGEDEQADDEPDRPCKSGGLADDVHDLRR
ncbi:MAG: tetratricopeptide repeat protein [Planctomycetes bacterium]|nr:tetratricopeptide repeat protein [Planctomycetota bacterium]